MEVIKKINNNVALAIKDGKECIIVGKGVGFKQTPYILEEDYQVEKIFYDIDPVLTEGLTDISPELFDVVTYLYNEAKSRLNIDLSANFVITLSDHIQFALQKQQLGIELSLIFTEDVKYVYQQLYDFSIFAVNIINEKLNVNLPYAEASNITLHLVNNSTGTDLGDTKVTLSLLEIMSLVENKLTQEIDKDTYEYYRFIAHLRMLLLRDSSNRMTSGMKKELYNTIFNQSPVLKEIVHEISNYFYDKLSRELGQEEKIYLAIYLNRFINKEDESNGL